MLASLQQAEVQAPTQSNDYRVIDTSESLASRDRGYRNGYETVSCEKGHRHTLPVVWQWSYGRPSSPR